MAVALCEKVMLPQRPSKGVSSDIWGECIPGKGRRQCKGLLAWHIKESARKPVRKSNRR